MAQTHLVLPRPGVYKGDVHRAGRAARAPAGAALAAGVLVAISQLRAENASVAGRARQLGTTWNTVWSQVKPLLEAMAADESRFEGVTDLRVDEHIWHHVSTKPIEDGGRAPRS